ncbi:MAG: gliding motility-associated C-terminal domain-containing protein [Bacteroidia bacterium]
MLILLLARAEASVNSPIVRCVSVAANGDVTLSWDIPADPLAEFQSYDVYSSSVLNGPYTLQSSVTTYLSSSYTVTGAGANSAAKFFYVQTTSTGPVTMPATDTLKSIYLNVSNPANGTALLNWNAISSPLPSTSSASYSVYMEYPAGSWNQVASSSALSYIDTIAICSAFLNYRIELSDGTGCTSVSSIDGAAFVDGIPPVRPILDSVSINAAGQAVIGLLPSASTDASCYIIYQHIGATVIAIDTLCGNIPAIYLNASSTASAGVETYDIASIDSCGNVCTHSLAQNTIFVSGQFNLCAKSVILNWNAYKNMVGGLKEYQVLVSVNGAAYSLAGTSATTSFIHSGLIPGNSYCYMVRAVNNPSTATSSSNKACFLAKTQSEPSYIYVKKVSVTGPASVDVEFAVDNSANIRSVNVYTSEHASGPFTLLANVPFTGNALYTLSDNNVSTASKNYYYYAQAIDSCGIQSVQSNTSKTIVLSVTAQHFLNTLTWDDYSVFLGNVVSYNIYRSVDDVFATAPIASVPFGTLTYTDDVSPYTPNQGRFSYYVEAVEGNGNPYGFMETSNSNIVEAYQGDSVFIPNAFVPRGMNKIFLPVTQYVEKTDYKLVIFNRFGNAIWETSSDEEGWDGKNCEGGVYVYLLQFKNSLGEYKEYKGTVTLVR